jgi:3-deoxy-manno-octulosonate cytidylyltransferase (CMP-KDO synthetase)
VVNLQGDEPLLDPAAADSLVTAVASDDSSDLATLAHPLVDIQQWQDPHCVKVVVDRRGYALYFSRAAIPGAFPGTIPGGGGLALRHIGIYAFRHEALLHFLSLPRSPLEQAEGLEQLRALEHGLRIKVCTIAEAPIGVDTPADLEKVRGLWPA